MAYVNQNRLPPLPMIYPMQPREVYTNTWAALKTERDRYESVYEDLTDFITPHIGRMREHESRRQGAGNLNRAGRVRPDIINNKATMDLRSLVNNLMAGLTSPARAWLKVGSGDAYLDKQYRVKLWQAGVTKSILHIAAISNYYTSNRMQFKDLAQYGTAPKIIDEDFESVINCFNVPNGSYVLDVGENGAPNRLMYEFELSVENIIARYGWDACSQRIRDKYDASCKNEMMPLLRVIEPNQLFQGPNEPGLRGMRYSSAHMEVNCDGEHQGLLRLKGYHEQCFSAPRWDLLTGDIYGASPGMETLGDIKGLQLLEQRKAQAIDKQVTPPTQGPPTNRGARIGHLPGNHTVTPNGGNGVKTLYEVRPDMISLANEIQRHEYRIGRAFYTDILRPVMNLENTPNVKAAQVAALNDEKMMDFGPVLERTFNEHLSVDVQRIFAIANRGGLIPPPPEELKGYPIRVTYTSPFAQLQKAIGIGSIEKSIGFVGQVGSIWQQAMDKINPDAVVDAHAEAMGAPVEIYYDDETVKKIRASREQQVQAEKQAVATKEAIEGAKTASETNITDPSLLNYLIGGGAQQ